MPTVLPRLNRSAATLAASAAAIAALAWCYAAPAGGKADNPCAICHMANDSHHRASGHFSPGVLCRTCHGESAGHVAAEDDSVRADRPFRDPATIGPVCAQCHKQLPRACGEEAACVRCHDPHTAGFQVGARMALIDDFESGRTTHWRFRKGDDWVVGEETGNRYLSLRSQGVAGEKPRRPVTIAYLKAPRWGDFRLTVRARNTDPVALRGRSLVIAFAYADDEHFYYAHLCNFSDPVHNNLLVVNEADRTPLDAPNHAPPVFVDREWHTVRLLRRCDEGLIEVYCDGTLLHRVIDRTFSSGLIGLGTFGSKADFDDLKIEGVVER